MERERPAGVLLVAVLEIVLAIMFVAGALGTDIAFMAGGLLQLTDTEGGRAVVLGFGVAYLIAAAGMLTGRRWGWALSMVLIGLALAVALLAYANGQLHAVRMAVAVAAAFYLNQRAVREFFYPPADDAAPAAS
jgi:hypothetical protein